MSTDIGFMFDNNRVFNFGVGKIKIVTGKMPLENKKIMVIDTMVEARDMNLEPVAFDNELSDDAVMLAFNDVESIHRLIDTLYKLADKG